MILGRNATDEHELAGEPASIFGASLTLVGELWANGDVRIQGRVDGVVTADRVVLEPEGRIEGSVVAREVHIDGRLIGQVFAPTVSIGPTAAVSGTVFYNKLFVSPDAVIDGRMPWRPMHYFEGRLRV